MSIHAAPTHRTSDRCDRLAGVSPQAIRPRPAPRGRSPVLSCAPDPARHLRATPGRPGPRRAS
ncbi:hypothetical protein [Falsiroseomonas sp. CW058]|uniref:hypothetical protein n=1 Tax=Falsiroseomonas sp. CW058 TaxID=3388664 RepID=UPI003D315EA9